jgi:hypothetical protein
MAKFKMPYGKYEGKVIDEIFKIDPTYIEWVLNNSSSEIVKINCKRLLYGEEDNTKIENIVVDSLIKNGYSTTEANIFIRKLKGK